MEKNTDFVAGVRIPKLLLLAGLFVALVACAEDEPEPVAPEFPLQWICEADEALPNEEIAPGASVLRGLDSPTVEDASGAPMRRAERLLGRNLHERALVFIESRDEAFRELPKIRYLKAWGLARRAERSCMIPDALEALGELEGLEISAVGAEASELREALETLLGFDATTGDPWPVRFAREFHAGREAFLARSLGEAEIRDLVARSPWHARQIAQREFLDLFAQSWRREASDETQREQRLLDLIAEELGDRDRMLHDTLQALADARIDSYDAALELREALAAYARGVVEYENQQLKTAEETLSPAIETFDRYDVPLARWARFYSIIRLSYEDNTAAIVLLDRLAESAQADGYTALAGRATWIASTSRLIGHDLDKSVDGYHRATELLAHAGGADAAAFMQMLLAEVESRRGNQDAAWRHRRQAFMEVPHHESLRRIIALYWEASGAMERQGRAALAAPLHRRAVALARRWGLPLGMSTSLHSEAMGLIARGSTEEALQRLEEAKSWIDQMEESTLKQERRRTNKSHFGRALIQTDPQQAQALLGEALEAHRDAGRIIESLEQTPDYARTLLLLERPEDAAAALRRGLGDFETAHAAADVPATRATLLARARRVGDLLIELTIDRGEPQAALHIAESLKRHRYERTAFVEGKSATAHLETIPGFRLSSYVTDGTIYWWLSNGRALIKTHRVSASEVFGIVERLQFLAALSASRAEIDESLAALHALLAPLELHDLEELAYVPDRNTLEIPLAALYDADRGRYLIENTKIRIAAGFGLEENRDSSASPHRGEALLIGVTGGDTTRRLKDLEAAEAEVRALADEMTDSAVVLAGDSIPPSDLVEALERRPRILHFAGHSVRNSLFPWKSYLSLGENGEVLTLGELRDLDLRGLELAVLSSCTSLDGLGEHRDAAFGLAGALVAAGAESVLASTVRVKDARMIAFMRPFYQNYRDSGADAALAYQRTAADFAASEDPETSPADWMFWNVLEIQ